MSKQEIQFAKTHLRNHLATLILPHVTDGIWSIYDNAKLLCEKNKEVDQTLKMFQNLLTRVATWTDDTLTQEVSRIISVSKCEYLEELITGTFLAYMRAFAAMQYRSTADSIEIEFDKPSLDKFIHELYKQVARGSWQHAYLFKTYAISAEQQARNRKEIGQMIEDSLDTVIDSFLPWKDIAKNYFKEVNVPSTPETVLATNEELEEEEEEKKPETPKKVGGVKFAEEPEVEEFDDEEAPPPITIGEDAAVELNVEMLDEPVEKDEDVELKVGDETMTLKE